MKKTYLVLASLLVFVVTSFAQLPPYYNYNTNGTNNSFPFNIGTGKMIQVLFLANSFNQPNPAPAGNITKFYFRIGDTYPLAHTYTSFYIRMGQTSLTTFAPGAFYTGSMDTVFSRTGYTITAAGGSWYMFTLDNPRAYDPTQSLVVEIGQCGVSPGTGFSICNQTASYNSRNWSVGGCPFAYSSQGTQLMTAGIDVGSAVPPSIPNLLYYKFENNPSSSSVLNCAIPGVGTGTATVTANILTPGGQFDTCLTGAGTASGGITTGWNCNLGTSSWTLSMWLTIPTTSSGSAYYLFGDGGSASFRCFHNGVALPNNLVLRGGFTDVTVTGIGPAPTVVTFVYDSAAGQVRAYKDGVLAVTSTQVLNITTGSGFKAGGYGTSTSYVGKMDEFRLWKRALTPAEVTAYWNSDPGGCGLVGINNNHNQIPNTFKLEQNYPNPFNPTTDIKFSIPEKTSVKLIVYDILGREVATLINGDIMSAGNYDVTFKAGNLASGVYMYKLQAGDFTDTKRMMLIK